MSRNKYNAKKTTVYGITFDSKREAARYLELHALLRGGEITDLKRQVPFELIPPQKVHGKPWRGITYIADFTYKNADGEYVVEDVKGVRTEIYRMKKKMMWYFNKIEVKEI